LQSHGVASLSALRAADVLSDDVLKAIDDYIEKFDDNDEVVCYSHLKIIYTDNDTPQKLHRDHFGIDERQEIVFAVDVSGSALATRVFSNTHKGGDVERSYCDSARVIPADLRRDYGPFTDLPRSIPSDERCQALRLLTTLMRNLRAGRTTNYTEVQTPAMLFDAGSFHSGGLPTLNTVRLFLTFRSKYFYDMGSGNPSNDTWFADEQPWVPLRNIQNRTFTSLQEETGVISEGQHSKKQRTRMLGYH
jgi:hypothetical protein